MARTKHQGIRSAREGNGPGQLQYRYRQPVIAKPMGRAGDRRGGGFCPRAPTVRNIQGSFARCANSLIRTEKRAGFDMEIAGELDDLPSIQFPSARQHFRDGRFRDSRFFGYLDLG